METVIKKTSVDTPNSPQVEMHLLPAHEGDFIWLRFGNQCLKHNIIIDGGTKETAGSVKKIFEHILSIGESIDAIFVTHIDADHIAGLGDGIAMINGTLENKVKAVYLNTHRAAKKMTEPDISLKDNGTGNAVPIEEEKIIVPYNNLYSPGQAISFLELLKQKNLMNVMHEYTVMGKRIPVGDAFLYVISPGIQEMVKYVKEYEKRVPNDEPEIYGANSPPIDSKNLCDYSSKDLKRDTSKINRSSMAFLFCYGDVKLLLLGDSAPEVCVEGRKCFPEIIGDVCPVDALKISHHGSNHNTSEQLLNAFPTDCYVLSTNGRNPNGKADVPHRATISQILKNRSYDTVNLICNYPWWETTYKNRYFTEMDKNQFLRNGILKRVNLQQKPYEAGNGLIIYGN